MCVTVCLGYFGAPCGPPTPSYGEVECKTLIVVTPPHGYITDLFIYYYLCIQTYLRACISLSPTPIIITALKRRLDYLEGVIDTRSPSKHYGDVNLDLPV